MRISTIFGIALALFALPLRAAAQTYACGGHTTDANCARILDDGRGELVSTLLVRPGACDADADVVDVNITVDVVHQAIGDLAMSLSHPDGTTVQVLYRPGFGAYRHGCVHDDMQVSFDDEASASIDETCADTIPAASGAVLPFNPLAVLDGKARNGVWTLRVRDVEGSNYGALRGWSLALPCALATVEIQTTDGVAEERDRNRTGTLVVSRGGDTTEALTVRYVVSGSASSSDIEALSGELVIPAGAASAELVVTALDDDVRELEENVVVSLEAGDYTVGARGSAEVVLLAELDVASDGGCGCASARASSGIPASNLFGVGLAMLALWRRRGRGARRSRG